MTEATTLPAIIHQVREELAPLRNDFAATLPSHISPEKFTQVIITALERDPSLLDADRNSLLIAAKEAATDGLLPDKKEGAFVVYNTKVKLPGVQNPQTPNIKPLDREVWIKQVRWMPMIFGIRKKMFQTGKVKDIQVELVHEHDVYRRAAGDNAEIFHEPLDFGDRGKVKGGYAIIKTLDGGVFREVMSADQIEAVAKVSKSDTVWGGPFRSEMERKTILRRLAKQVPLSAEVEKVLSRDDHLFDFARERAIRPDLLPGGERHHHARKIPSSDIFDDTAVKAPPPEEEAKAEVEGEISLATKLVTDIRQAKDGTGLLEAVLAVNIHKGEGTLKTDELSWLAETVAAKFTDMGIVPEEGQNFVDAIEAFIAKPPPAAKKTRAPKKAAEPKGERRGKAAAKPTQSRAKPAAAEPQSQENDAPAAVESGATHAPAAASAPEPEQDEVIIAPLAGVITTAKGLQTWEDPALWVSDLLNKMGALSGNQQKAFWKQNEAHVLRAYDGGHAAAAERILKVAKGHGLYTGDAL